MGNGHMTNERMQTSGSAASRAVVTLTIGDTYREMASITHGLMKEYAEKCGADFVVVDSIRVSPALGRAAYEKFQLYDLLDHFDQIAFVDTDILIAPDSPSLFEVVPMDTFGAVSEEEFKMADRDKRVTQEVLGPVSWINPYFNSGMMVMSKAHREVFDPHAEDLVLWATGDFRKQHVNLLNDQPYLNHRINKLGIRIKNLGRAFNYTCAHRDSRTRFENSFIHYSGPSGHRYGTRISQLRADAGVLRSKFWLGLSRRCLLCRWILDRMHWKFFLAAFQRRVLGRSV